MSLKAEFVEEKIETLLVGFDKGKKAVVERKRLVSELFEDGLQNDDIVECPSMFKKVHSIQESVRIGHEVMAARKCLRTGGTIGEDERRNCLVLAMGAAHSQAT